MAGPYDVPLSWLASFVAVAERGGFTAAGRASYRSQSRISMHVAALERELDVTLLERTSRGARLTEAGARFLPHARAALADLRAGVDSVRSLAGRLHGTVLVGSDPGASAVLLAPLMKRFREEHPGVSVELREGQPRWLEEAVAHAEVDLAIRPAEVPQRYHDVVSRSLFAEPIVLVVSRKHRFAAGPSPDLRTLERESVIVTGDPSAGWSDYRDRLVDLGVDPARLVTVAQPTTLAAMVRYGLGVGILGGLAAEVTVHGGLAIRELPGSGWKRDIRVYTSTRRRLSVPATSFLDLLTRQMS